MTINREPKNGFTLAELLIALAILGVIATFTIPKILDSGSSSKHNSIVKEAASTMSQAHQLYKLNNTVTVSTDIADLTPFLNYVKQDTTSQIDNYNNALPAINCSGGAANCLLLHNGSILYYTNGMVYTDTASTSAIWFLIDPDGTYGGSATGPSKSTIFYMYMNGMLRSRGSTQTATYSAGGGPYNPDPTRDPEYFSWSN